MPVRRTQGEGKEGVVSYSSKAQSIDLSLGSSGSRTQKGKIGQVEKNNRKKRGTGMYLLTEKRTAKRRKKRKKVSRREKKPQRKRRATSSREQARVEETSRVVDQGTRKARPRQTLVKGRHGERGKEDQGGLPQPNTPQNLSTQTTSRASRRHYRLNEF